MGDREGRCFKKRETISCCNDSKGLVRSYCSKGWRLLIASNRRHKAIWGVRAWKVIEMHSTCNDY